MKILMSLVNFMLSHYLVPCYPYRKILRKSYEDVRTSSIREPVIDFLMILAGTAFQHEKIGPIFSSFNPCSSLPSLATVDRKQFQCLNVGLNNKTGTSIFRIQLMQRDVLAF